MKRPRRNRVTPFGTIEATSHQGSLMGNRGDLHADDGSLGRQWKSGRWLSCVLDAGDGWRAPMDTPGRYYPLFFHDEAVAMAAGHRPCGECRPEALAAFLIAWKVGHGVAVNDYLPLSVVDRTCHAARISEKRARRKIELAGMPDGTFVWAPGTDARPLLLVGRQFWPWEHGRYDAPISAETAPARCYQLTPTPMIAVLCGGYRPALHPDLQRVAKWAEHLGEDLASPASQLNLPLG